MNKDTGYYRKSGDNIEYVEIKLIDEDGEEFDMETLRGIFKDTLDSQKDKLEKIVDFGTAILGDHYKGVSFMFGWVVQKIINTYETKNETKLKVVPEVEQMDSEEIKVKTVDLLKDILQKIEDDEIDVTDMPLNMAGGMDYE